MSQISFTVYARPVPQGSMKGFVMHGKNGAKARAVLTSANAGLKPYRGEVTRAALAEMKELGLSEPMIEKHVPVSVIMSFFLEKPVSAPKSRRAMVVKPDLSKLVRATEDALTGVVYFDDAQIVEIITTKKYGTPERVEVSVTTI